MGNNKNTDLLIGLGVILVVIGGVWYMMKGSSPANVEEMNNQGTTESTEDLTEGSINVGAQAASLSYQQALVKYKDARIQLNKDCQASPSQATYKNNTSIMIDNRSAVARTVKVGSTFPIKAWGFKIVKLSSATLPVTWLVDCDKSQNVATILIQK